MKTDYQFISDLFNKTEKTNMQVNNLQVNAYKVRINGNIASIEALCINEYGTIYRTNDVRTVSPTKKQLNRLQKFGFESFVYED